MELESYKDGTLLHIGTDKGGKLQVNDLLAVIGQPGEDISGILKGKGTSSKAQSTNDKGQATSDKAQVASTRAQATSGKKETKPAASNQLPATSLVDITKMEEVVLMPRLSDTMTEGVIASWQKNVGDMVKKGDILAEIETDKATMDLESYKNGTLLYIGAKQGEKIAVNELLCIIGEKGKVDIDAIVNAAKGQGSQGTSEKPQETSNPQPSTSNVKQASDNGQVSASSNGRIKASPLAKKLAAEKGIDLKDVHGTGDGGRITKEDIDNYKAEPVQRPAEKTEVPKYIPAAPVGEESFEEIPVSQMRKTIAKRLADSKFT